MKIHALVQAQTRRRSSAAGRALLVGAFLACLAATAAAQQEPLAELFVEDFQRGVVGNESYRLLPRRDSFQVDDIRGQSVSLHEGAILVRPLVAGSRVAWRLTLDFPPARKGDEKPAAIRLGFVLASKRTLTAVLTRGPSTDGVGGEARFERENDSKTSGTSKLREPIRNVTISSGDWEFEYNQGMISVRSPAGAVLAAYDDSQTGLAIPVIGLFWEQEKGVTLCKGMKASSTAVPGELDAAAQEELAKASGLNLQAQTLSRGGDSENALTVMREASGLFRQYRGDGSRDYANSVGNLADVLAASQKHTEALEVRKNAVSLFTALLGSEHPQTALAFMGLGEDLLATKRPAEAAGMYREAARVFAGTSGEGHSLVKSLKEISEKLAK